MRTLRHSAAGELKMLSFWAGGISSFPPCAREYRLLRSLSRNKETELLCRMKKGLNLEM